MKIKNKSIIICFFIFLLTSILANISFAADLSITKVGVQNETDLIVYWDRLANMQGYNVTFKNSKGEEIETIYVEKDYNFAVLEDYSGKSVYKVEIVGVRSDNTTVSAGHIFTFKQGKPLDVNKVFLGAYEQNNYLYPTFNPSDTYTHAKIIGYSNEYKVSNGCINIYLKGKYELLAELMLQDGVCVYGTYAGEVADINDYQVKATKCMVLNRRIVKGETETITETILKEDTRFIQGRIPDYNNLKIYYVLNTNSETVIVNCYNIYGEFIRTEMPSKNANGFYELNIPIDGAAFEIIDGQINEWDYIMDEYGNLTEFEEISLYEEVTKVIEHNDSIEYMLDSSETVYITFFNSGNQQLSATKEFVKNSEGIYSTTLPKEAYSVIINNGLESFTDTIRDKNGNFVAFSIPESHTERHNPKCVLEGTINHQTTSTVNKPYAKVMLELGEMTLMDMVVNGEIIYKQMTDNDMKNLYIPLNKGSNTVSIVVYTLDGDSQTKSFIINYEEGKTSDIDDIVKSDPSITFDTNWNNKTVQNASVTFSGQIFGGDILSVNGTNINLTIDMKFSFKAGLKEGENRFVFSIKNENGQVYNETVTIKYVVPDLITDVDSLQNIDREYKEKPEENVSVQNEETEEYVPTYEEMLSGDMTDMYIFAAMGITIFVLIAIITIQIIRNKKKK